MEATNENGGGSSSGGGGGGSSGTTSRWNPTKEQLNLLEGLYGQGIRTPSAEQIQSITKKLQVYGHIEGKNVFYWFQNHKARQRQKQKIDQMTTANNNVIVNHGLNNNVISSNAAASAGSAAYFNRFYYPSPPVSPSVVSVAGGSRPLFQPPPHNVAYSPYYIAQPEFGFYQHCPNMVLPNHLVKNSQTSSTHVLLQDYRRANIMTQASQNAAKNSAYSSNGFGEGSSGQVTTLDLFPLHPTGNLRERDQHRSASIGSSTDNSLEAGSDQDHRSPAVQTSLSPPLFGFDVLPEMGSDTNKDGCSS